MGEVENSVKAIHIFKRILFPFLEKAVFFPLWIFFSSRFSFQVLAQPIMILAVVSVISHTCVVWFGDDDEMMRVCVYLLVSE